MADDKLLSFLAMEFADDYGQEFFFQDKYDDSSPNNNFQVRYFHFSHRQKPKLGATILYAQKQNVYF